jgi:pyridoxamine 5'-phosphate oxidase
MAASLDPIQRVREWYGEAVDAGLPEPNAMALATATPDGVPSLRFVLLKAIDDRGIEFFSNYESRKGRELAANPRAAAALYWRPQQRQIRIEGPVEVLTPEESDAYFATRARGSRIGARASPQSEPIRDREWLMDRVTQLEAEFGDDNIPRPPYWGGYRLVPEAIELWQGQPSRLHDRTRYVRRADGTWSEERLAP